MRVEFILAALLAGLAVWYAATKREPSVQPMPEKGPLTMQYTKGCVPTRVITNPSYLVNS
jgi:hypothetical protein